MSKVQKWLSLLLCACLALGLTACTQEPAAKDGEPTAEITAAPEATAVAEATDVAEASNETDAPEAVVVVDPSAALEDDAVLATANGVDIVWGDVKSIYDGFAAEYGDYYDMTDPDIINMFRSVALENGIIEAIVIQEAEKGGVGTLSEEDQNDADAQVDASWESAIDNYVASSGTLTVESTEEEIAAARAEAEAYYHGLGYSVEELRKQNTKMIIASQLKDLVTQDIVVSDEEIEALYQDQVAGDKELYENNIVAYVEHSEMVSQMEMYAMIYGVANEMEPAWYRPAGIRMVKHILLPVDAELMETYKGLQARLEEQTYAEETAGEPQSVAEAVAAGQAGPDAVTQDDAAEIADDVAISEEAEAPEPTEVPVTQADVDNAKADVLASLADTIDEINQKLAEGVSFEELITIYGVNEDGTASDPGMVTEPTATVGYEVVPGSNTYVPEFTEAAFSMEAVGDVSAPYLSDFGVHIVKYVGDVPAGPVEMTQEQREAKRSTLLTEKQNETFNAKIEEWKTAASVQYTGFVPSMDELEQMSAEGEAVEQETTEAPVE